MHLHGRVMPYRLGLGSVQLALPYCLQDRTLQLWNPLKGLFIKAYVGHGYEVRDVSVCGDNSKLSSVGGDRQVRGNRQASLAARQTGQQAGRRVVNALQSAGAAVLVMQASG